VAAFPVRARIAAVHGTEPIEVWIADRHAAVVDVPSVPLTVGVHDVVEHEGAAAYGVLELGEVLRLRHAVPLFGQAARVQSHHPRGCVLRVVVILRIEIE